jgi:hypothetical protein
MADPRNANRLTPVQLGIRAAAEVAAARFEHKPFLYGLRSDDGITRKQNPADGFELEEWEHDEIARADETEAVKQMSERDREARRDEMQYKTAFRTAFELGVKAGKMQRLDPPPCVACENRKKRNRIAAQASRLEKRRIEKGLALPMDAPSTSTKRTRRPTGGTAVPYQDLRSSATTETPSEKPKAVVASEEEELEASDEDEPPPPF